MLHGLEQPKVFMNTMEVKQSIFKLDKRLRIRESDKSAGIMMTAKSSDQIEYILLAWKTNQFKPQELKG